MVLFLPIQILNIPENEDRAEGCQNITIITDEGYTGQHDLVWEPKVPENWIPKFNRFTQRVTGNTGSGQSSQRRRYPPHARIGPGEVRRKALQGQDCCPKTKGKSWKKQTMFHFFPSTSGRYKKESDQQCYRNQTPLTRQETPERRKSCSPKHYLLPLIGNLVAFDKKNVSLANIFFLSMLPSCL